MLPDVAWLTTHCCTVMVNFMSIRLRSVGLAMNYPVVVSSFWGTIAERVLEEEGLPYAVWTYLRRVLIDTGYFIRRSPLLIKNCALATLNKVLVRRVAGALLKRVLIDMGYDIRRILC